MCGGWCFCMAMYGGGGIHANKCLLPHCTPCFPHHTHLFSLCTTTQPSPHTTIYLPLYTQTVYQELDVDTEMQRGLLPGLIALSAKLVPTIQRVAQNTVHSIQQFVQEAAGEQQGYAHKKVLC